MKLKEAIEALDGAVVDTLLYFEHLDPSNLATLLQSFRLLKDNKEKLSQLEEAISKCYQKLSYETIPAVLKSMDLESTKTGGHNFILSARTNASMPEEKRKFGIDWLTNEAKIPELVKQTVNPKQLSSFAQSYFEAKGCWPPEEAMTVHLQEYIQVRKA